MSKKGYILTFLVLSLLMGLVFDFVETDLRIQPFPFNDRDIRVENYIYYGYEHLSLIALCVILYNESVKLKDYFRDFLMIKVLDFVDYLLTCNRSYFIFNDLEISFNTISFTFFIFVIIWREIKLQARRF